MNTITRRRLTCRPRPVLHSRATVTVVRRAAVPVALPALVARHAPALATVNEADARYFARIAAALYIVDPKTGRGIHLCEREQCVLFAALNTARDNGDTAAAHLAARLDAI